MTIQDIVDEIKLELTGGVLELEIEDAIIEQLIKRALREIERFWDETTLVTIPYSACIDLNDSELSLTEKVAAIVKVYRTEAMGAVGGTTEDVNAMSDPLYMQQWMIFSNGGTMYNLNDYVLNYASYQTLSQIKNTVTTDMAFKEDKHNNKLYINSASGKPNKVTIEYIPKLISVEQIKDEYWIDNLIKMSMAMTKVALGRIRTRFVQSNALWTQDGETLLNEGNTELKELRDVLVANSNLIYGVD